MLRYTYLIGSGVAFAKTAATAIVAIGDPGLVYEGVSTTVTITITSAYVVDRVDLYDGETLVASDVATPFVIEWTPSAAGIAALTALGYIGVAHVATGTRDVVVGAYADWMAAEFAAIGGGPDELHWARAGAEYETLSGSDVTQWGDLSGHGNHATDGTNRPAYVDVPDGDSYLAFTGANSDHLCVPYSWSTGCTAFTIYATYREEDQAGYDYLLSLWSQISISFDRAYYFNIQIGAVGGSISGLQYDIDHTVVITYDGTIATATERVRVWIDGIERFFDAAPAWPSVAPSSSAGTLGARGASADMQWTGRIYSIAAWYSVALTGDDLAALHALLRRELALSSGWTSTGTDLVEHYQAAPTIGADLALTCTGLTVTPGTPIEVYDKGAAHVGFTGIADLGAGHYRVYWKDGLTHVDPTGKIQYADSTDYGETWAAPVDWIDTPGVCDGSPRPFLVDGVQTVMWSVYPDEYTLQLYSRPAAGGAIENIFGYPQIVGTQKVVSLGCYVDNGALVVAYGGPSGTSGWLCTRVGGTDVYWTAAATQGGNTYRIFEPYVVRLVSGSLLLLARTGFPGNETGPTLQLRSTDNGITWGNAQLFPATHDGEPLGIDAPMVIQMSTGTLVLVGRRHNATGVPMTLHYSTDDGATWSAPVDLLDLEVWDGGYCGLVEDSRDPTQLLISYYCLHNGTNSQIAVLPVTIEAA